MGDHVIFDSVVDLAGHDAAIQQVILGVVGSEAHDASGPTARHSSYFQQFFNRCVIDVYARVRRGNGVRFGGSSAPLAATSLTPGKKAQSMAAAIAAIRVLFRMSPFSAWRARNRKLIGTRVIQTKLLFS